ncbi:hypothetical protein OF113_14065 [Ectopseudomonas chengduensis]|nr:hypothetical protein [Pseudomonas chengduensis]UZT76196.1 hypothetical protein OF113_14065 [Pseudomonas chengduensis]
MLHSVFAAAQSKDYAGDELFISSRKIIEFLLDNYPEQPFPFMFSGRYLIAYLDLLRGFGTEGFNSERLYYLTSLLLTEWGWLGDNHDTVAFEFYAFRSLLSAANAQMLVRDEVALVETAIKNAKVVSNYDAVQNYIKEVKDYDSRLADLKKIKVEADRLKESLNKYTHAFNFVGLYDGFANLKRQKVREKNLRLWFLFVLGVAALAPLVAKISLAILQPLAVGDSGVAESVDTAFVWGGASFAKLNLDMSALLTFVALELLILYFFRITLHSLKSVRAQLLQIDLRMTLCQFIDKYAEYAQGKGDALKGFESVIFSGLVTVDEKLPATFDGFDVLQGLAEKLGRK